MEVASWLLIVAAEFAIALVQFIDDMPAFVDFGLASSKVVFVQLFVNCTVITIMLDFVIFSFASLFLF